MVLSVMEHTPAPSIVNVSADDLWLDMVARSVWKAPRPKEIEIELYQLVKVVTTSQTLDETPRVFFFKTVGRHARGDRLKLSMIDDEGMRRVVNVVVEKSFETDVEGPGYLVKHDNTPFRAGWGFARVMDWIDEDSIDFETLVRLTSRDGILRDSEIFELPPKVLRPPSSSTPAVSALPDLDALVWCGRASDTRGGQWSSR